jgi:hypothetical protein
MQKSCLKNLFCSHPELVSGSHIAKQNSEEMLKQVQHDFDF